MLFFLVLTTLRPLRSSRFILLLARLAPRRTAAFGRACSRGAQPIPLEEGPYTHTLLAGEPVLQLPEQQSEPDPHESPLGAPSVQIEQVMARSV